MNFGVASNTFGCLWLTFRGCRCQFKAVGLGRLIPRNEVKCLSANPISKSMCSLEYGISMVSELSLVA